LGGAACAVVVVVVRHKRAVDELGEPAADGEHHERDCDQIERIHLTNVADRKNRAPL
jgi:hypothetical protein